MSSNMKDWYFKDEKNQVALQIFGPQVDLLHDQQQTSVEDPCLQIIVDLGKKIGTYLSSSDVCYNEDTHFLRER